MPDTDSRFMAMALALAERGLGNVWPNPAVGCVVVRDGRVAGRGWTQPGGIAALLATLAEHGITRLLVEGGAVVATAFLRAGLVDRIHLFTAPLLLGGDAAAAVGPLGVRQLGQAPRWRTVAAQAVGQDRLLVLEPA